MVDQTLARSWTRVAVSGTLFAATVIFALLSKDSKRPTQMLICCAVIENLIFSILITTRILEWHSLATLIVISILTLGFIATKHTQALLVNYAQMLGHVSRLRFSTTTRAVCPKPAYWVPTEKQLVYPCFVFTLILVILWILLVVSDIKTIFDAVIFTAGLYGLAECCIGSYLLSRIRLTLLTTLKQYKRGRNAGHYSRSVFSAILYTQRIYKRITILMIMTAIAGILIAGCTALGASKGFKDITTPFSHWANTKVLNPTNWSICVDAFFYTHFVIVLTLSTSAFEVCWCFRRSQKVHLSSTGSARSPSRSHKGSKISQVLRDSRARAAVIRASSVLGTQHSNNQSKSRVINQELRISMKNVPLQSYSPNDARPSAFKAFPPKLLLAGTSDPPQPHPASAARSSISRNRSGDSPKALNSPRQALSKSLEYSNTEELARNVVLSLNTEEMARKKLAYRSGPSSINTEEKDRSLHVSSTPPKYAITRKRPVSLTPDESSRSRRFPSGSYSYPTEEHRYRPSKVSIAEDSKNATKNSNAPVFIEC
ncbi:hypothetical protein AAMO2058_000928000 [Amorphochlora amoebiformis]|uniref:Uncharacterized protein n=1 Tax=Amorphochlora amoebiformis TaxID=1561963 RepID=A0A7S0DMP2_9EUKA